MKEYKDIATDVLRFYEVVNTIKGMGEEMKDLVIF